MTGMRDRQIQQQITQSMQSGAARMLNQSRILEPDELVAAVVLAQGDSREAHDALTLVVNGMTQMVYRMAETYTFKWASHLPDHTSFDDIFAGGLEGLQKAVARFEESRGYAFTTYASWWIRNGVQKAIYDAAGGGSIRAKALIAGVAPDDPLAGGAMLSLDYETRSTFAGNRSLLAHEGIADPRLDLEPFDYELVRSIYDIMSCVDQALPEIIDLIDREFSYREIARIVGISAPKVKALHERGAQALADSGLLELEVV
jgi:RNA polymerase sigma factor (sigma-70 family)